MADEKVQNDLDFNFDFFDSMLPAQNTKQLENNTTNNTMKSTSREIKKLKLSKRIAETDALVKQHREEQDELRKQNEIEKNRRIEMEEEVKILKEERDINIASLKELKRQIETTTPVSLNKLITSFVRLASRSAGHPNSLSKTDLDLLVDLKEYCTKNNISMPMSPKKEPTENKLQVDKSMKPTDVFNPPKPAATFVDKAIECCIWNSTPQLIRKPDTCTRSTECENVYLQHKTQTQNASTSTSTLLELVDVGTMFPEPIKCWKVYEILDEMNEWDVLPISPLPARPTRENDEHEQCGFGSCAETIKHSLSRPISPLPASPTRKNGETRKSGIGTCTEKIKRSQSRPPSRATNRPNVKIETGLMTEMSTILMDYINKHMQDNDEGLQSFSIMTTLPCGLLLEIWKMLVLIFIDTTEKWHHNLQGETSAIGCDKNDYTYGEKELENEIENMNLPRYRGIINPVIQEESGNEIVQPEPLISENVERKIRSSNDENKYSSMHNLNTVTDTNVSTAEEGNTKMLKDQQYSVVGNPQDINQKLIQPCSNNEILNSENDFDLRRIHLYPKTDIAANSLNTETENDQNTSNNTVFNRENHQDGLAKVLIEGCISLQDTSTDNVSSDSNGVSLVTSFFYNLESNDLLEQLDENEKELLEREKIATNLNANSTRYHSTTNANLNEQEETQKTSGLEDGKQVLEPRNDCIENEQESCLLSKEKMAIDLMASFTDYHSTTNANLNEQEETQKTSGFEDGKQVLEPRNDCIENEQESCLLGKEKMAIDLMASFTDYHSTTNTNQNEQEGSQKTSELVNAKQVLEPRNDCIEIENELCLLAKDFMAKSIGIQSNGLKSLNNNTKDQKEIVFENGKKCVETNNMNKEGSCLSNQNLEMFHDIESAAESPDIGPLVIDDVCEEQASDEANLLNQSLISTTSYDILKEPEQNEIKPVLPNRRGRKRKSETISSNEVCPMTYKRSARLEAKRLNSSFTDSHPIKKRRGKPTKINNIECTNQNSTCDILLPENCGSNANNFINTKIVSASDTIDESPASPVNTCSISDETPVNIPMELSDSDYYLKRHDWTRIIPKPIQLQKTKRFSLQKKNDMSVIVGNYLKTQNILELSMIKKNVELFLLQLLEHIQETPEELNLKPALLSLHQTETVSNAVIMNNIIDKLCAQKYYERPRSAAALNLTKAYLECIDVQKMLTPNYKNPARFFIVQILYFFQHEAMRLIYEVLCKFPTVLPHRDTPDYDDSDVLITVIKHELMQYKYDMNDVESCGREMLSKLRYEYYYKAYQPTFKEVLDQLIKNLKTGHLQHLEIAFSLFCKRMKPKQAIDEVINGQLVPLTHSYYDLANQSTAYDERLETLLDCISITVKALPLETDVKIFLDLFKRFYTQGFGSQVQQAAARGIIRLQRFGFIACNLALRDFRPSYVLQAKTTIMLRTFAQRSSNFKNKTMNNAGKKPKRGPKRNDVAANKAKKKKKNV